MKRTLCCHHYGRYVDDFYVVSSSREYLINIYLAIVLTFEGLIICTRNRRR